MRKLALLLASGAAAATLLPTAPAYAVGGYCNGAVDADCYYWDSRYGQYVNCTVWIGNCAVGA